ncbi:glycosyltransferase family 4 protein [Streptomyces sp. SB3404]|uniref:D-inositol 3-phosphate glycosyltransferase n=1 Tax=Streptomyces boncukensis TaxID=2711219 RepID=A0A6G4X6U7_9ACTN|nr:glycosyltransferase family 4 protein [Streptomyces boncukensis]NGO72983.1 glycosyltransferase family 4 protein [Streptomyces boncukensis]
MHAVQVLGGGPGARGGGAPGAETLAHVRSLSGGLVARGVRVTVCGAGDPDLARVFTEVGAGFAPAADRAEPDAATGLRELCADADVVHAHGLHAGMLAALALGRRRRRIPLVVTWHTPLPPGADAGAGTERAGEPAGAVLPRALLARLLRRRVARAAAVVLGVTTDLVDAARRSGARDARLAPVAVPGPCAAGHDDASPSGPEPPDGASGPEGDGREAARHKVRAELGATGRPLLLSVGRLDGHQGYDTALTASRAWRDLDPQPLLAIAGEGPERAALQRRIDAEELPVRLLGRRDDALWLLAGADLALLPVRWESRSVLAQEALRRGVPLVATAVGGLPELVGDAAELVPYADGDALAAAVRGLLRDPARRAALAAAGRVRAASWPTEHDTVAHVLAVYDELTSR